MRLITFSSTSKDNSNAIFKLMDNVREGLSGFRGQIRYWANCKASDIVVADSPVVACNLVSNGFRYKDLVVLMHSFENERMQEVQKKRLEIAAGPGKLRGVIVTSGEDVAEIVRGWGYKAKFIPIAINPSKFTHMPYPEEFTIGYLGASMSHKRFDMVEQAGQEAGVKILGSVRKDHVQGDFAGREPEFYKSISCYVSATLCEHAPFPTLEALLCGRPLVISPIVSCPPELRAAVEGGAGEVADDDTRVEAILKIRDDFERYVAKAREFKMNNTAGEYERFILECVGGKNV